MNKIRPSSDGVVRPRYTNEQLKEFRRRDVITQPLAVETSRLESRKKAKAWKRAGLLVGAAGVLYALSGNPTPPKGLENQLRSYQSQIVTSVGDMWDKVITTVQNSYLSSRREVSKHVEAATPVVSKIKEQVVSAAGDAQKYAVEVAQLLPAVEQVYNPLNEPSARQNKPVREAVTTTPIKQEDITPAVTRRLSQAEIDNADQLFVAKVKNEPEVAVTETGTPTPSPLANVDLYPDFEGTLEKYYSETSPFDFVEANVAMRKRNLVLADLFYADKEKIHDFDALYSENDILPIFPENINKWSNLAIDLCNEHNQVFKDNPNKHINPNFILAIMSIESQGIEGAHSPMLAKGLMQITTPIAEKYGYNSTNIYEPENNLIVSINYFADLKETAIKLGLTGSEVYEFAAMAYNGGWNADKYFMTSRVEKILGSRSAAEKIFKAEDMEGVKQALLAVKGNINSSGNEYFTFGTRLTKVETLKYREKLVRFVVIAELADDIEQDLIKKGIKKETAAKLTRKFIKTSGFIKAVNEKIRSESNPKDYFEEKKAFVDFLTSRFDLSEFQRDKVNDSGSDDNPAWFLMYR